MKVIFIQRLSSNCFPGRRFNNAQTHFFESVELEAGSHRQTVIFPANHKLYSQENLKVTENRNMSRIFKFLKMNFVFKIHLKLYRWKNYRIQLNLKMFQEIVYPAYFTGNMADSTLAHKKPIALAIGFHKVIF